MSRYVIHRYYSIVHGCKVARVSVADAHGREYFATVPLSHLRSVRYRDRLDAVLDDVQAAIDDSRGPGEVATSLAT